MEEYLRIAQSDTDSIIRLRDELLSAGFPAAALTPCTILDQRGQGDFGLEEYIASIHEMRSEKSLDANLAYWATECVGEEDAGALLASSADEAAEMYGVVPSEFGDSFHSLSLFFQIQGAAEWALFCLMTQLKQGCRDGEVNYQIARILHGRGHYLAAIPFFANSVLRRRHDQPGRIEIALDALLQVGLQGWVASLLNEIDVSELPRKTVIDCLTGARNRYGGENNLENLVREEVRASGNRLFADDVGTYLQTKQRHVHKYVWEISRKFEHESESGWTAMAAWFNKGRHQFFLKDVSETAKARLQSDPDTEFDLTNGDPLNPEPFLQRIMENHGDNEAVTAILAEGRYSPAEGLARAMLLLGSNDAAIFATANYLADTPEEKNLWYLLGCRLSDVGATAAAVLAFSVCFPRLRYQGRAPRGELSRVGAAAVKAGFPSWGEVAFREDLQNGIVLVNTVAGMVSAAKSRGILELAPDEMLKWFEDAGFDSSNQKALAHLYEALIADGASEASTFVFKRRLENLSKNARSVQRNQMTVDRLFRINGKALNEQLELLGTDNAARHQKLNQILQTAITDCRWSFVLDVSFEIWKLQGYSLGAGLLENMVSALVRLGRADEVPKFMDMLARKAGDRVVFDYPGDPALAIGKSELAREKGLPGIVLFTMPKSASVHIWVKLSEILDLPRTRISGTLFGVDDIAPEWAKIIARRPSVCQQHVIASPANVEAIRKAGFRRIVVHVRDPRQAMLSWIHHIDTEWSRGKGYTLVTGVCQKYCTLSLEEKISRNIDVLLPEFVNFAKSWMDVSRSGNAPSEILFTSYESMLADRESYIANILSFYGLDDYADKRTRDRSPPQFGLHHFRKGQPDEWKEVFDARQKMRALELIPSDVSDFFGWER